MSKLVPGFLLLATVLKPAPAAPKRPVTDVYQGNVKVVDDYRWLENADDPETTGWMDAQDTRARAYLSTLPRAKAIGMRVRQLMTDRPPSHYDLHSRGGRIFTIKSQPPKQQPFLVTLSSPDDIASERTIVDPNVLDAKGTTAIDFYEPSLDGTKVAVSLSRNGDEEGDVHVYSAATGEEIGEPVPRVNGGTAGGSLAWNANGSGFWYTRYPRGEERPVADRAFFTQVYFHKLGTRTEDDAYCIGRDFPRIAEIELLTSDDGRYVRAKVANGDGGDAAYWLLGPDGDWKPFARYEDKVISAVFGGDGGLYVVSRKSSPMGAVLRLDPAVPDLTDAPTIVGSSPEACIRHIAATRTRLYVTDIEGGPSRLRVFDLPRGTAARTVPMPAVSTVDAVVRLGGDQVLFANESFVAPLAWYRFDGGAGDPVKTALSTVSAIDYSDTEVVRELATSKDGTRVPMNILRRKGVKLDGSLPTILWGYGGYGVNIEPGLSPTNRLWLEHGGVMVIANLRGGGEYGESWHLAGNLTHKQNVFDDYYACARWLIDHGYTRRGKLALEGGSNGGLLMGATLTQHPELATAVVSYVGIYDMLRAERHPNGAFNVTEFGTVTDPAQFQALQAYSPYHHVVDGTKYPAVLLTTGIYDPRVDPANSRKMTARLQAATASKAPILLRVTRSGHGIGSSLEDRVSETTDAFAFLFDQLGVR
jgi:prolyl oligopeptidase